LNEKFWLVDASEDIKESDRETFGDDGMLEDWEESCIFNNEWEKRRKDRKDGKDAISISYHDK